MKTNFFTIALTLITTGVFAQITVTDADVLNIGDIFFEATDTLSVGLTPGGSGMNQTWDFTNLQMNLIDTIEVLDPNTTPNGAMHPTADVSILIDSNYWHLSKSNNALSLVGVDNVPVYSQFSPLPLYYGLQSSSSYTSLDSLVAIPASLCQLYLGVPCDSVYIKQVSTINWNVDAYGDVMLPLGTFSSLRSKKIEVGMDSLYVHISGVWYVDTVNSGIVDTTIEYTWWTNEVSMHYRIVEMDYTNNTTDEVVFLTQPQVSSVSNISASDFNIYPIPATCNLTIEAQSNELTNLELVDITGKMVMTKQFNVSTNLDVSQIAKGIYYLNLNNNEGKSTKKIIVE